MALFNLAPWAWSAAGLLLVLRILGTALNLPSGYGGEAYLLSGAKIEKGSRATPGLIPSRG